MEYLQIAGIIARLLGELFEFVIICMILVVVWDTNKQAGGRAKQAGGRAKHDD